MTPTDPSSLAIWCEGGDDQRDQRWGEDEGCPVPPAHRHDASGRGAGERLACGRSGPRRLRRPWRPPSTGGGRTAAVGRAERPRQRSCSAGALSALRGQYRQSRRSAGPYREATAPSPCFIGQLRPNFKRWTSCSRSPSCWTRVGALDQCPPRGAESPTTATHPARSLRHPHLPALSWQPQRDSNPCLHLERASRDHARVRSSRLERVGRHAELVTIGLSGLEL